MTSLNGSTSPAPVVGHREGRQVGDDVRHLAAGEGRGELRRVALVRGRLEHHLDAGIGGLEGGDLELVGLELGRRRLRRPPAQGDRRLRRRLRPESPRAAPSAAMPASVERREDVVLVSVMCSPPWRARVALNFRTFVRNYQPKAGRLARGALKSFPHGPHVPVQRGLSIPNKCARIETWLTHRSRSERTSNRTATTM